MGTARPEIKLVMLESISQIRLWGEPGHDVAGQPDIC
jgi:hypothetical protein